MLYERVTIIIPTRNEEKTVGEIIEGCKKYSDDIIVIDGHSTDRTKQIAQDMGVRVYQDNKKGKGEAVRVGIEKAQRDILVFIDADGSHSCDDIPKLIQPILDNQADLVTGSRMTGGSDELHGDIGKFIRMVGSDIITLGINYRFGVRLTDSVDGFRAIRREVALKLGLKENIASIEHEIVIKTLKKGYRATEVPTHEYARRYGDSRINIKKVWLRFVYSWLKYLFF